MATLNLSDAKRIAAKTRPWTLRLECVDPTTNTSKFWYATGRGLNESVETGSGRIGAKPALRLVSFAKFEAKVLEKLGKDYDYASTGFVRMSPANLAKLGGLKPSAAPTGVSLPPAATYTTPKPVRLPVAVVSARPQGIHPPAKKNVVRRIRTPLTGFNPPPMGTPLPGLQPLTGPYSLIRAVLTVKDGFTALDKDGDDVLDLTLQGGQELVQDYGIPVVFTR
jgi:hypothetical protein